MQAVHEIISILAKQHFCHLPTQDIIAKCKQFKQLIQQLKERLCLILKRRLYSCVKNSKLINWKWNL